MRWGSYILVTDGPLPPHGEVAIVLQGSILAQRARLAGAAQLLQNGTVMRILLSLPRESYWGQSLEPIAKSYIERTYGQLTAAHTLFCETGQEVNSTEQEAVVLAGCVKEQGWDSIILVTSDYHTRRSKMIWRRVLKRRSFPIEHLWVDGVKDKEFHRDGWWKDRLSAKIWVMECTKLLWTFATSFD